MATSAKQAKTGTVRQTLIDSPATAGIMLNHPAQLESLEALEAEEKVIVNVPKEYTVQLTGHVPVKVYPGQQRMAKSMAEHWWSKANGVEIFEG